MLFLLFKELNILVFSSVFFLFFFFPCILIIYFLTKDKYKNFILFLISLFFYAWGEPIYVSIMIISTLVDYFHGKWIHINQKKQNYKMAKYILSSSIFINLSLLIFFKYSSFILTNINNIFSLSIPVLSLSLPIGISFYTFQTMSYTIDIYKNTAKYQNNIINFGTYISFFPQLIAGPIVKYKDINKQILKRKHNLKNFGIGISRFLIGLAKKVILANNIGILAEEIFSTNISDISFLTSWLGPISFGFQIYFDFSGYSDMAIGISKILGFDLLENFNYPYISKSITEFWRRWHISLSSWFKEYVYIPLGGNRSGIKKQIVNILIVWLATGIWHGASWNFIIWGIYFAIILIFEKLFILKIFNNINNFFKYIYTIILIVISWSIFYIENIYDLFIYINRMFSIKNFIDIQFIYSVYSNIVLFIILIISSTPYPKYLYNKLLYKYSNNIIFILISNIYLIAIFILSIAFLVDSSFNPFLYFRF